MYAEFNDLRYTFTYKTRFNGQMNYLETALNDRFDPTNRDIYIQDAFYSKVFIYLKSEVKPAIKVYRKWNSTTSFGIGKFCWYQGDVYVANAVALNKIPGTDPEWTIQPSKAAPILRKKANYNGQISFIVMVPVTLVYSQSEMNALINYYKLAGRGYTIQTY